MSATNGIHAVISMSAPEPAEPIGTKINIEVGFIEFLRDSIPLTNRSYNDVLSVTHRYEISDSGLYLINAEGMYDGKRFYTKIFNSDAMKGTILKLTNG